MQSPSIFPPSARDQDFDLWVEAGHAEKHYWLDLWRYRELFLILAWRDVAVRYKQTVAGTAWALVQPLLTMIIMTVIFGKVAGLPSIGTAPYAIMVFAALLPWQFFSNALSSSGQSVISNRDMISKVYFPRIIIPAGSVLVSLVDFLISLVLLAGLMAWYQFPPVWNILYLPIFLVVGMAAAMGAGLVLTALTVHYRDFRILVPFIVQFGLYVSPVALSLEKIREKITPELFFVYCLNPMVFVIEGFRWCVLGGDFRLGEPPLLVSCAVAFVLLAAGIFYFRKTERTFADII
ncbi:MAG: ABC transporter permease [Chthoniobacterales bacterium]|nr:ABC transporter permease [Chthoniobacterales bacterium]